MRFYETTIVLNPQSDDAAVGREIDKITQTIASDEGKLVLAQRWGIKRLAYPVQKFNQAHYVHFVYQAPPSVPGKLEAGFHINEAILRHLTVLVEGPLTPAHISEAGVPAEHEAEEDVLVGADEALSTVDSGEITDETDAGERG